MAEKLHEVGQIFPCHFRRRHLVVVVVAAAAPAPAVNMGKCFRRYKD